MRKFTIILIPFTLLWLLISAVFSEKINDWEIVYPQQPLQKVVFFGDSLTTGYGMKDPGNSYPLQLSKALNVQNQVFGYNGITSTGALEKIHEVLAVESDLLIITLGGNDILHSTPLEETIANLDKIFTQLRTKHRAIAFTEVLTLMDGDRHEAYVQLCRKHKILMIEDISSGILFDPQNKCDSIHPNSKGCTLISERILETLQDLLPST